ncbi:Pho86p KNAG_0B01570 [Huiozyma naganishii CBS 8797]|uniref:Inorganic phosphate transporter PHO86 n=1 Tax=Huiozyma naganishii (strain ATCC MYA-139 / BCRC 22969 / CBS 8797 / KCTC 17520 / NBRC 10181 / NCYC 3082 / Yp74L-3) TaxID=1071383 RepID=J7S3A3_HUIN7|nr:hypothetical protein KNAG_0B01570 [Kazachstania naganishii CBS 8797]CCK68604.1 hypothetical protein KNAG_0B01570 [Kazachstania naganishii CBS 8797]
MVKQNVKVPRIEQVDASLNKPLDKDAPPTIFQTRLTPEYATAAMTLAVDFVKQKQALATKYLVFHPLVIGGIVLLLAVFMTPRVTLPQHFSSVTLYCTHLVLLNKKHTIGAVIFLAITSSFMLTLVSRVSEAFFKAQVSRIEDSNGALVFNKDLAGILASGDDNTNIVVYRNTPIALVSIKKTEVLSDTESLCMVINSIGCRRVYLKSGILEDLIDWANGASKQVHDEQKARAPSLRLILEVYSFDGFLKETLAKKGFHCISSRTIAENKILGGVFGAKKELWGVQFHIENKLKEQK